MPLSNELISQFAKITKDKEKDKKETTVYGTVVDYKGTNYVRLDGSELLTPVTTTVDAEPGERVAVLLKNHSATVTGNISSPAVRTETVKVVVDNVADMETVLADTVRTDQLNASNARIESLEASNVTITETVNANSADIETLQADVARIDEAIVTDADIENLQADIAVIKENLTANNADISTLKTDKLDTETANATYATITNLEAANADITNLESDLGSFETLTSNNFTSVNASIDDLQANKLSASDIEGKYANIDFSNISKATMGEFYANSGLIQNVVVGDSTITGKLVGVTISGDLIEGNTVKAEKLVIKGTDGLYYKLNTDGVTTEAEQTNQNSLDGSVIKVQSITASKIAVDDLVAFDATIGGFNITNSAIYSGIKETVGNTTRGSYLDNEGQVSFGDASNYIKYYKVSEGVYKLDISASSVTLSSSGTSVETAIATAQSTADAAQLTANTAKTNAATAQTEANNAKTAADAAQADADALNTRLTSAETSIIQNSNDIALRATKTEVSAIDSRLTSAESSITILANSIESNVTETTNLGTRTSTLEQTADGLTARMSTAETNVSEAQSTANIARTEAANSAKTATNFLSLSTSDGLIIGDKTASTLGGNVQIKAETGGASISLRDGATILSKFSATSKAFSGITSATTSTSSSTETLEDEDGTSTSETITSASQTVASNQTKSVVKFESSNPIYFSKGIATNGVIVNDDSLISNVDFTLNGRIFDKNGKSSFEPITGDGNLSIGYGRFKAATSSSTDWSILYGNKVKICTKNGSVITQDGSVALETLNSNGNMVLGYHLKKKGSGNLNLYAGDNVNVLAKHMCVTDSTGNACFEAKNPNGNTTIGYARYVNGGNTNIFAGSEINLKTDSGNVVTNCSIIPDTNSSWALGKYNEKGWSNIYIGNASGVYNGLRMIVDGSSENMCGRDGSGRYIFGNNGSIMYYYVKNVSETVTGTGFRFTSGNFDAGNNTVSTWLFGAADSTSRYMGSYLAYNRTYSSAANMVVTANGVFGRSTSSSQRYKNCIEVAEIDELKGLYDLPIKKFKYNNDYIAPDDELYGKYLYGIIVEDLESVLPCAVQYKEDENGEKLPEMWNSNIIVPSLLKLIQDLNKRVKVLEAGG